jgi:TonB family protein
VSQPNKTFKVVAGVHIGVIVVAFFHSGVVHLFEPKPEITQSIEFVVDVTPPMPDVSEAFADIPEPEVIPAPAPIPEPIPAPIPEPIPVPVPTPKPPPKRKPRPPIEVSRRKVRRSDAPKRPKQKQLSEAEIQKLLAEGATAGDYTSIPDKDSRCLALIQKTLYAAWVQPSSEAAGGAVALLNVAFEPSGRVRSCKLQSPSGSAALDASVQQVAQSITRIHGLTPDFVRRHATVSVSFTVE